MANIRIKQQHQLGPDLARQRVEQIAQELQKRLDAQYSWQGDCLHFQRSGASGTIQCAPDHIDLDIKLGMLLSPMKGAIEKTIRDQIAGKLSKP